MRKIEFIKDFATRKKGEVIDIDSYLAGTLVRVKKVAKFYKKSTPKAKK